MQVSPLGQLTCPHSEEVKATGQLSPPDSGSHREEVFSSLNSVCGPVLKFTLILADSKQVRIYSDFLFPSIFEDPPDDFIAKRVVVGHLWSALSSAKVCSDDPNARSLFGSV